ncbi:hypothetical protein RHMOL_Rhmol07G0027100 [Rhododendron molle]|uniref:Uncharacterized protein n=1 Tax=Rhododendron molle TaxID=49168 RepID=A0ACC0MW92_RHOML|nr:hypothetical protein RHMOL_Rhmol07G0027100 [Rhododendron molle]
MENQNPVSENLPKLLILRPPHMINLFEDQFSDKFHLLKPWESPIPTDQFLAAHCASVEAMLISGRTPMSDHRRRPPPPPFAPAYLHHQRRPQPHRLAGVPPPGSLHR